MPVLQRLLPGFALALAALLAGAATDPNADLERALYHGDAPLALKLADAALAERPKDVKARFLRAVSLGELGRIDEAMQAYVDLLQDYPELAEPYNNLAALQAARGDLDEARVSLETALRNHPGMPVALENLGDVYLQLAVKSWSQAAQSAPAAAGRDRVGRKLAMVRELQQRTR